MDSDWALSRHIMDHHDGSGSKINKHTRGSDSNVNLRPLCDKSLNGYFWG